MGSGKSTIGKLVAASLGHEFIDTDHELERRMGVSIPTIFDYEGEDGFRVREHTLLTELINRENTLLATGGGIVKNELNRQLLQSVSPVIFLNATVASQFERTRADKNRPLLQVDNPQAKLQELYDQRLPLYRAVADMEFQTDGLTTKEVADTILSTL